MFFFIFYTFIYLINLMMSSIFFMMKHPLTMGMMLLIQTILICLITGLLTKSFWFSYILFLIFLGGMLVLFIYVISLASNEMFNFKFYPLMIIFFICMISSMMIYFLDKNLVLTYFSNNETKSILSMKPFLLENTIMLNKIYNFPINLITVMLMIYLFLTLIACVKITNIFEGPLRPKN